MVWSQAVVGNTVYAAGRFTQARPAGVAVGGAGSVARGNLMVYNITTGVLVSTFAPSLNAQAKVVAGSPDGSRVYVGGSFTTANGQNRYRLAAYSTATGLLISTFAPILNATVNAITATNTTVYVGGAFSTANNVARSRLAAFSASNGALLGWAPRADGEVQALVLTPDGSKVIAGGSFTSMNGSTSAYGLAAINASTGALLPWAANKVVRDAGTAAAILSLSTDGTAIYGTGYVYAGKGGNLEGTFSADPDTGAIKWIEDCHGDTYSNFATNGAVYVVGHPHFCSNVGGFPQTAPDWTFHRALQFSAAATGTLLHNTQTPTTYADFGGRPSPDARQLVPGPGCRHVHRPVPGGLERERQLQLPRARRGIPQGERGCAAGPGPLRHSVARPEQAGTDDERRELPAVADRVSRTRQYRVGWLANWDRDDQTLTYKVVRNGDTTHPIYTTTATSQFWHLPGMGFYDKGLTPGATYQYRISASDLGRQPGLGRHGQHHRAYGESRPVRAADTGRRCVRLLAPRRDVRHDCTRLGGIQQPCAGRRSHDRHGGSRAQRKLTEPTPSAAQRRLARGTANGVAGPNVFSLEAWFKTSSITGGKIAGLGNARSGLSTSFDRQIYMDNTGHVIFGVYNVQRHTVTSPGSVQQQCVASRRGHVVRWRHGALPGRQEDRHQPGHHDRRDVLGILAGRWRQSRWLAGDTHEQLLPGRDRRGRRSIRPR